MKKEMRNSIARAVFAALAIVIEFVWIFWLVLRYTKYTVLVFVILNIIAIILALRLYDKMINAAYKISWIIILLAFPLLGIVLYILLENHFSGYILRKQLERSQAHLEGALYQDEDVAQALKEKDRGIYNQTYYLSHRCGFPVYRDTDIDYYGDTTDALEAQKEAMRTAEHFIFIEYFAIEDSTAWRGIEEILIEKAANGVDVRVYYDDFGSISFVSPPFVRRLQSEGIQCRVFNPLIPILDSILNYRSHRKITVVDGKIGFVGGYNLADEYFNLVHPYGQWKDSGVRISGTAVRSLTISFLEMWNTRKKDLYDDPVPFLPEVEHHAREDAFVQPYADSPFGPQRIGRNVYLNMIKHAERTVFFSTPYLILDDDTQSELTLAARRGVDVRIVTPGIPDKKLVYRVTRSYYGALVASGVRIYEYTPGFIHAKQTVCDDEIAAVGSINLDFRSLYLNFENGCLFYNCQAVQDVRHDFDTLFQICEEVTEKYDAAHRPKRIRFMQSVLRLFSPLM